MQNICIISQYHQRNHEISKIQRLLANVVIGEPLTLADARGNVTAYAYDQAGRVTRQQYPNGDVTTISYDNGDRVASVTTGTGTTTFSYASPLGQLSAVAGAGPASSATLTYDDYGRPLTITDGSGTRAQTYDDADDVLTATTSYAGLPDFTLASTYHPDGSLAALQTPMGAFTYRYDADGRLTALTNPTGRTSTWQYGADTRLSKQVLGNRAWTLYRSTPGGQIAQLFNGNAQNNLISADERVAYDDFGRLTHVESGVTGKAALSGHYTAAYDTPGGWRAGSGCWGGWIR